MMRSLLNSNVICPSHPSHLNKQLPAVTTIKYPVPVSGEEKIEDITYTVIMLIILHSCITKS